MSEPQKTPGFAFISLPHPMVLLSLSEMAILSWVICILEFARVFAQCVMLIYGYMLLSFVDSFYFRPHRMPPPPPMLCF